MSLNVIVILTACLQWVKNQGQSTQILSFSTSRQQSFSPQAVKLLVVSLYPQICSSLILGLNNSLLHLHTICEWHKRTAAFHCTIVLTNTFQAFTVSISYKFKRRVRHMWRSKDINNNIQADGVGTQFWQFTLWSHGMTWYDVT